MCTKLDIFYIEKFYCFVMSMNGVYEMNWMINDSSRVVVQFAEENDWVFYNKERQFGNDSKLTCWPWTLLDINTKYDIKHIWCLDYVMG